MKATFFFICFLIFQQQECGIGKETSAGTRSTPASVNSIVTQSPHREWVHPKFAGLLVGVSTEEDVRKIFGRPVWEGSPEEEAFDNDSEGEILLDYDNFPGGDGKIAVTIGARSRTILAIAAYPQSQRLSEVKSEYGSDFFELDSGDPMCSNNGPPIISTSRERLDEFPYIMLYPTKGIYVSVNQDFSVNHIGFLSRCPDYAVE